MVRAREVERLAQVRSLRLLTTLGKCSCFQGNYQSLPRLIESVFHAPTTLFSLPADLCLVDVRLESERLTLVLRSSQLSAACASVRAAICSHPWPLYTPTFRSPLPGTQCSTVFGGTPFRVRYPWLFPHHLRRTLPDADSRLRAADAATSRGPQAGARQALRLAVPISRDTLLQLIGSLALASAQDPTGVGPGRFRLEKRRPLWRTAR